MCSLVKGVVNTVDTWYLNALVTYIYKNLVWLHKPSVAYITQLCSLQMSTRNDKKNQYRLMWRILVCHEIKLHCLREKHLAFRELACLIPLSRSSCTDRTSYDGRSWKVRPSSSTSTRCKYVLMLELPAVLRKAGGGASGQQQNNPPALAAEWDFLSVALVSYQASFLWLHHKPEHI